MQILGLIIAIIIAYLFGKLVSKLKLPSILGWLIIGMIVGPCAFKLVNQEMLDNTYYKIVINVLECTVGLLIGTELVWSKIKKSGKQIVITTSFQSLTAYVFVSIAFGILFYFQNIPVYLALIFGSIALATAPAPVLSIVNEFKTKGPVTNYLIPMAALDDIIAVIVFFTTISIIATNNSESNLPIYFIFLIILVPVIIGIIIGVITGFLLRKIKTDKISIVILILAILVATSIGIIFNHYILPKPVLNFMMIGIAFSATFANMITEEKLKQIMKAFNSILGFSMIIVILNLGMPLDYRLILGAGVFTFVYIISRALGKYIGAFMGAKVTKSPDTVKKYLGLTLLPHSGVSLVFTGIAVSVLTKSAPDCAKIIQGTIAAAAVINEIIAVIIAKKAFKLSGELNTNK